MFKAMMVVYYQDWQQDGDFQRRMMAYTLIHPYGIDIIADIWLREGKPEIASLSGMMDWLWPRID
jgi:hypothetical protein